MKKLIKKILREDDIDWMRDVPELPLDMEDVSLPSDIWDKVDDSEGEEKASLLHSIKLWCIKNNVEKPKWWYSQRNRLNWLDNDGTFLLGYDLGGF